MKFIVFALIVIPALSFSQISIKGVVCNWKGKPLSFTNIVSVKKQNGTATDERGLFQVENLDKNDSLKFTNIAYYSELVPVESLLKNDTVFLIENTKTLDEVIITNFANFKTEQDLGFLNFKSNASFDLKPGGQIALFIENKTKRTGWIKQVSFKAEIQGKCKCGVRVRVIQPDASGRSPDLDLLNNNIIVYSNDLKRTNTIT